VVWKSALQALPVIGRVADAKARGDLAGETAALEILDRARRFLQLAAVELHRLLEHAVEVRLALFLLDLLRRARLPFRHLHADAGGEVLHRVDIAHAAVGHEETDRVAVRAAAEAVIELLGRADGKRRRLLVVERAEAGEVGARFLEAHVARNDFDDVDPVEQILLERLWNHGALAPSG